MRTQVIIIDIFNREYLQSISFTGDGKMLWTSELAQCSFYEEEDIPQILRAIDEQYDGECWIKAEVIHVKGND